MKINAKHHQPTPNVQSLLGWLCSKSGVLCLRCWSQEMLPVWCSYGYPWLQYLPCSRHQTGLLRISRNGTVRNQHLNGVSWCSNVVWSPKILVNSMPPVLTRLATTCCSCMSTIPLHLTDSWLFDLWLTIPLWTWITAPGRKLYIAYKINCFWFLYFFDAIPLFGI